MSKVLFRSMNATRLVEERRGIAPIDSGVCCAVARNHIIWVRVYPEGDT